MLILDTTDVGRSEIRLRAERKTVWLSQREMAQLFDVSQDDSTASTRRRSRRSWTTST